MFENIWKLLRRVEDAPPLCAGGDLNDPLSHPAILRMSPAELADLPIVRGPAASRREHAVHQDC